LADYTVVVFGETVEHSWLCHLECLREAAHSRFADFFATRSE
jgi:hypothetical protein